MTIVFKLNITFGEPIQHLTDGSCCAGKGLDLYSDTNLRKHGRSLCCFRTICYCGSEVY